MMAAVICLGGRAAAAAAASSRSACAFASSGPRRLQRRRSGAFAPRPLYSSSVSKSNEEEDGGGGEGGGAERLRDNYSSLLSDGSSVAVVGGGLAGLSAAHHLLRKAAERDMGLKVTVFDREDGPGVGGASSVAGGLLHPFSPRGTLLHNGSRALASSNVLLERSLLHRPDAVLRNRLYRVALTEKNAVQLRTTAEKYPQWAKWLDPQDVEGRTGARNTLGGLELGGGCRVIHVPTYLRGLWEDCVDTADMSERDSEARWVHVPHSNEGEGEGAADGIAWRERLAEYDAAILSAGSGLFRDCVLPPAPPEEGMEEGDDSWTGLPVDLVRGQSVELSVRPDDGDDDGDDGDGDGGGDPTPSEAVLCGKYVAPLPDRDAILIGATHEFQSEPLSPQLVADDLRARTSDLAPGPWSDGEVRAVTEGYRVQSRRGPRGRLPIAGRAPVEVRESVHENSWLFTGLSSRGLIYHGVYGDALTDLMMGMCDEGGEEGENPTPEGFPDLYWWMRGGSK
uniref:FAD dependent oxidoreductase domain-containing protein n=1 Tax=Odontella aurita TaxID=265563 RepID=A0A7S4N9V8_9STRA